MASKDERFTPLMKSTIQLTAQNSLQEMVDAQHQKMFTYLERFKNEEKVVGLDPKITPFGVRVRITDEGWVIINREIFNWCIRDCRDDPFRGFPTEFSGWTRSWDYSGPSSFFSVLLAAVVWDGQPDTEPSGWTKAYPDERRNGELKEGIVQQ